jgi:hypothetical protein
MKIQPPTSGRFGPRLNLAQTFADSGDVRHASKRAWTQGAKRSAMALNRECQKYASTVLTFAWLITCSNSHSSESNELSQIERFKEFIQTPPPIERVTFEVSLNRNFPRHPRLPLLVTKFFARYEEPAFLLVPVTSFEDVGKEPDLGWPERIIIGSSTKSSWSISFPGTLTEFVDAPFKEVALWEEPMMTAELATYWNLEIMLNLGFTATPIGGIQWKNNSFEFTNKQGIVLRGELRTTNDVVVSARVTHQASDGSFEYSLRYEYAEPALIGFLPSKITRTFVSGTEEILDRIIQVHSVQGTNPNFISQDCSFKPYERIIRERAKTSTAFSGVVLSYLVFFLGSTRGGWARL